MSDKYKVVMGSNLNLDYFDEKLVVGGISRKAAEIIANELNKELSGPNCNVWYGVCPESYVLRTSDPNQ